MEKYLTPFIFLAASLLFLWMSKVIKNYSEDLEKPIFYDFFKKSGFQRSGKYLDRHLDVILALFYLANSVLLFSLAVNSFNH